MMNHTVTAVSQQSEAAVEMITLISAWALLISFAMMLCKVSQI